MVALQHGSRAPRPWPAEAPRSVELEDGVVVVRFPGQVRRLPAVWARDNCPCPACRIEQTGEHRYFLGAVPCTPSAVSTKLDDDAVVVEFADGHEARYAPADFAEIIEQAARGHQWIDTWDSTASIIDFDHGDVVARPDVLLELCRVFLRVGAVRVTGMATEPGEVLRFLGAIGVPARDTAFGLVHDVAVDPTGYNVAHTAEELPPHNDFASYTHPPSGQLLHMLANDVAGGDSVLVDGFDVVERLRAENPAHVDVLARVPVAHRQWSADVETWARAPLITVSATGDIVGLRFSNQLLQPLDPEHPSIAAWYVAYQRLAQLIADPSSRMQLRLEAGQMLMVNGHRVLHARTAFDPSSGARRLQDAYFFDDDIRGRAAVLSGDR